MIGRVVERFSPIQVLLQDAPLVIREFSPNFGRDDYDATMDTGLPPIFKQPFFLSPEFKAWHLKANEDMKTLEALGQKELLAGPKEYVDVVVPLLQRQEVDIVKSATQAVEKVGNKVESRLQDLRHEIREDFRADLEVHYNALAKEVSALKAALLQREIAPASGTGTAPAASPSAELSTPSSPPPRPARRRSTAASPASPAATSLVFPALPTTVPAVVPATGTNGPANIDVAMEVDGPLRIGGETRAEATARFRREWGDKIDGYEVAAHEGEWIVAYEIQTAQTIREAHNEYSTGLNGKVSIRELDRAFGTKWRRNIEMQRKRYERRMKVVREVERRLLGSPGKRHGKTVDDAVREVVEQVRTGLSLGATKIPSADQARRYFESLEKATREEAKAAAAALVLSG